MENMMGMIDRYTEDVPRSLTKALATLDRVLQPAPANQPLEDAISRLGTLIDLSGELERPDATAEAIRRGNLLLERELSDEQRAIIHYFLANAWEVARGQRRVGEELASWEQPEIAAQVIHLRRAVRLMEVLAAIELGGPEMVHRRCQIYTNLGNVMSQVGRLIDAFAYWDQALELEPRFAMAIANRGYGLIRYAQLMHDPGHHQHHLRAADAALSEGLQPALATQMHSQARTFFAEIRADLRARVPAAVLAPRPPHAHFFPKRMSQRERAYREWCLHHRLFLNDLNDLYRRDPIAAHDLLALPDLTTAIDAPLPHALGFFNQLKQEFASARFLYYEGVHAQRTHFADRDVTLIDTLDYPAYGHPVEQTKIAYRLAYSLFDKIAYFLNDFLALAIPEKKVSFRSVWYVQENRTRILRPAISRPDNAPLQGLFWLAKDFYEDEPGFTDAIEPEARDLALLRNHLEHKYVKLHHFGVPTDDPLRGRDPLAHALDRSDFERRTLRLIQLARSALMYLSMGVYIEEARRRADRPHGRVVSLPLMTFQDRFKL